MIRNKDLKSDCNGNQYNETPYNNNDSNIYQDRFIHVFVSITLDRLSST